MPPRYTEEFRVEAVKQVTVNNYGIVETAERLGIHHDSLRNWIKKYKTLEAYEQSINLHIKNQMEYMDIEIFIRT